MRGAADGDGVVRTRVAAWPRLAAALAVVLVLLLGAGALHLLSSPARPAPAERAPADPGERAMRAALERAAQAPPPTAPPQAPPAAPQVRVAAPAAAPGAIPAEEPEPPLEGPRQEVWVDQLPPGDGTGLDAFPKPGTKPILRGLIVPEGYTLPPGYMRHHQTTDDGEALAPILVFHPDHQLFDAEGRPIPLPPDRVVPSELAPSGMERRWLEPPPRRR